MIVLGRVTVRGGQLVIELDDDSHGEPVTRQAT
jgi:hypothetical protein